jgi:soluble lytic murein transglycosylase-like protein
MNSTTSPTALQKLRASISTFVHDVGRGVLTLTHSGLAMLGLALVLGLGVAAFRPDLLSETESGIYEWLRERQLSLWWEPQNTADRATATDLKDIPRKQAAVAAWLAKKYKVAPEPIAALVAEAYDLSEDNELKPHLILAVMAIESSFHPYVQSQAGAQGLMQVMTDVHAKKYQKYGGKLTAFDPLTNMRVGVAVLKDYIRLKNGSVEEGLLFYLGGDNIQGETNYVTKVLAEQARLDQVAAGVKVSTLP